MELDIVRAWKDAGYRLSLSPEQQALLPASPVGEFELSEADLDAIIGGAQGGSEANCQFTGDNAAQCPTVGNPAGSCKSHTESSRSLALGSGLLSDVSKLTGNLAFLCSFSA